MRKKDKKIAVEIRDGKVQLNENVIDGLDLLVGKKTIGQIVALEEKFAHVENAQVLGFHKQIDDAITAIIENYNLNH